MHGVDGRTQEMCLGSEIGCSLAVILWLRQISPNPGASPTHTIVVFAPANLKQQSFSSRSLLCKHSFTIGQADSFRSGLIQLWFSVSEEDSYYVCSLCLLGQGHQIMSAYIRMIFFPCVTHPCGRQLKDGTIDCEMHVNKNRTCFQYILRIIQSIKHLAYT